MSKGRKRSKAQRAANAAKFRMLPPPGGFCGGGPPHLVSPHGPVMLADHFHMRPPNCGPPIINDGPFINEPPEFVMRELNEHGPGFHPQEFETHPRFHHPHMEDRPRCFHPDLYENRPGFHPLENDCGTLRFVPPEFLDRPPGFVTPVFRDGPPRFSPEFRDGPSRFVPHDLRDRPPRFVPHELRDRPPRFVPLELRDGASVAGIWPSPFVAGPGQPRSTVNPEEPLDFNSNIAPMAPCPPHRSHELSQQSSAPDNNGNSNSTPTTTETSTPKKENISCQAHVWFSQSSYGFIEREDLKKYSFSFDAFFGKRNHLVPGVKVHFTAVKELKKEFATDVKVAPGGTEEIECTVYEGVVTAVLPESYVLEAQPGRIRTILTTETVKLPFGKMDSKATLLLFDRVKFQLCTDIITKVRRATNITPQMPETFQLTKETREKGVIMNVKDDSCTVMSKKHENLTVPLSEYLSAEQLKVMDEVEFTVVTVKAITKAIRLKKLPDGLVEFESKLKVTNPSACKSMWKPVTSKEAADHEDISSEKFDGTISRVIPQCSEKEMGRVDTTVADARKSLPFGLGDVITKATMMVGDKVQFNIVTNKQTKEERAVNIAIQPETFQQEPTAQRRIGMVIKLDSNCGFIRTQQDPKLVFDLSELMDDTKLNLSEKVEFTLAVGPKEGAEGKRAVRVRKLTESVFTPVPKLEEKKEKKKMTIKLLKDPKELIQKIKTEAIEKTSSDKAEASKAPKQNNKDKQENLTKGSRERTRSSRSSSHSRDRSSSHYGKRRSSSRDRSFQSHRRSRSRSRERSRTYRRRYSHSRSRSRSRERGTQSGKKRSHSPERRHPTNKEFRSPDGKNKTSKYTASYLQDTTSPSTQTVKIEIENKRKELLALNELIARKKAIIAMEQNTKMASQFKDALEIDGQHGIATFDYQHKHCLENSWTPDMKPVKSILKKQYESSTGPQHQKVERSDCSEEAAGSPHPSVSSIYMSPGTVPVWVKQSTTPEINDQELARKKRQLEELSEIIARKRAIIAMEQKVLCDGSEIKKKYDFASCSDDLDITVTNKNIWQLEIKPDLQPKKSILKKRSESVPDPPQKNLPSAGQYALFPISKQPTDDKSAILNPSEPSDASFKKPCNPPSIILNTFDLFKKLINESPVSSFTSKQSFNPSSGLLYDQKHSRESQDQWYSTVPSQISKFPNQNCEESSSTSDCSSASIQKSNLATQMERFLGALNKAGSNLMSSLLKDARKDSDLQESQMMAQGQAERGVSGGDELYDPFKETDCNEDYPLMGSKQKRKSLFGQIENIQDDLLPHERAVVDGSGFSKIVGMKHGIEAKAENRSLYEEAIPSSSQGRFVEERKMFLKACDAFKLSSDRYSDELYYDDSKYVEDRESYQRPKTSDRHSVEGSLNSEQQMSGDAYEEVDQKASQYKTIQDLLQTIGLNLDTTEVRKLADRTNERLYGKKGKLQRASSFHHKDERSTSRYDRRGSSHSTGSEGVCSVSPVKPSERKVYMSYLDSIKCHDEEASVEGRDMLTIKRTIRNSPEAKQTTPEPYIKPPEALHDSCNSTAGTFSVPQTVGSQYSQISSEYAIGGQQNPYGSVPVNPLNYSTGYSIPPPPFPPGYQNYTASVSMMPPSPAQFYPPFTMSPFTTSGTFDPSPSSPYPSTLGQFGFAMPSGSSGYATQLVKTKAAPLSRCLKTIQTVQSQNSLSVKVSAAEEMRTVISIKTQNDLKYTDCEAESQLTPVTEDDIKAKQKKRLEQFNQRMRLKKEQQMEAQRTRGLSQKSAPDPSKLSQVGFGASEPPSSGLSRGNVMKTEVKNVWICGHSLVFWAEKRATSPEIGMQLGMDPNSVHIWWKGMQGMTWQQLLPQLLQLKDNWPKPDVIIIHLGGNDIGNMTPENFVLVVKKDVISLRNIFPQCCLVWSDILPRKSWRHSDDSTTVNNMRHAVNKTIHGIMAKIGGSSLTHDNILPGLDSGLYRPDGVHLSGKGIDTFNLNMQDFLEKWEYEISETETSESKTHI